MTITRFKTSVIVVHAMSVTYASNDTLKQFPFQSELSFCMKVFQRSLSKKPAAYLLHNISVAPVVARYHPVSPASVTTTPNHALLFKYMDMCHPITMQGAACLSQGSFFYSSHTQ